METKDFEVPVWYRVSGTIVVDAETMEEASEKALMALDDFGERAVNPNDRDWGVV